MTEDYTNISMSIEEQDASDQLVIQDMTVTSGYDYATFEKIVNLI